MMGFSMFFPSENDTVFDPYLSSSSVDCTLSLGTPSTRLSNDHHDHDRRRFSAPNSNNISSWDFLHGGKKSGGGGETALAARRCTNCDTTSTPLWRNGPRGPKSLCNACGIRFKKEERRKNAGGGSTMAGVPTADYHGGANYYNNHYASSTSPWIHQHHYQQNTQRVPYYSPAENEYSFVDDVRDDDHDVTPDPFLSWRLNVADRASFVHDFTMQ